MRTITVALAALAIAGPTQAQQQPNHIVLDCTLQRGGATTIDGNKVLPVPGGHTPVDIDLAAGTLTFSMPTLRHLAASTAFIGSNDDATVTIGINRVTGDLSVRYVDVTAKSVSKDSWTCEPAAQKF